MKIPNPRTSVPYWDEGNPNLYMWFKKGKMKKILRDRFIRKFLKGIDKASD